MAGSQPVAQAAIIDLTTPQERAMNMSLLSIALNISFIFGPVMGGVFSSKEVSSKFGYNTPLFIAAGLGVLILGWIQWKFSETSTVKKEGKINLLRPITIFIQAFKDKKLMMLSFA